MTLNLIDAFSSYLVLAFVTGTILRAPTTGRWSGRSPSPPSGEVGLHDVLSGLEDAVSRRPRSGAITVP